MDRKSILEEAMRIVTTDRHEQHGEAEDSFSMIASLWEPYIKAKCVAWSMQEVIIEPEDVAILMTLFKIARTVTGKVNMDNFVDGCGYFSIAGEIAGRCQSGKD